MNFSAINARAINARRRARVVYPYLPNLTYTTLIRDGEIDCNQAQILPLDDLDYRLTITFTPPSDDLPIDMTQTVILGAI